MHTKEPAIAESIGPEPIPAETSRTLAVAELTTMRNLLVFLDVDGLQYVRNRLHSPNVLRVCDQGPLAETRAVLLDTTCRALAVFGWAPEQYFLECGDMLPTADAIEDEIKHEIDNEIELELEDDIDNEPGAGWV